MSELKTRSKGSSVLFLHFSHLSFCEVVIICNVMTVIGFESFQKFNQNSFPVFSATPKHSYICTLLSFFASEIKNVRLTNQTLAQLLKYVWASCDLRVHFCEVWKKPWQHFRSNFNWGENGLLYQIWTAKPISLKSTRNMASFTFPAHKL